STSGSASVDGSLVATAGTVTVDPSGSLSGSGSISADVVNNGTLRPGDIPGLLTITGNYTQTATGALDIESGGTTAGTQYDQLNVSGTAALDGTLDISLINGFGPAIGQSFTAMNFSSATGNFATTNEATIGRV